MKVKFPFDPHFQPHFEQRIVIYFAASEVEFLIQTIYFFLVPLFEFPVVVLVHHRPFKLNLGPFKYWIEYFIGKEFVISCTFVFQIIKINIKPNPLEIF